MNPWEKRAVPAFHLGLLLVAALVLIPFVWIIAAAFKSQISLLLGEVFFTPTLASFREVLFSRSTEFMSNTFNSLVVAAGSTLVILVAATLGGYAIERLGTPRWAVHTMLGWAVVFHMVPPITLVAAWFPLYREIGLDNTYLGLVLAHVAVHLPMALWLMTNFVRDVPIELDEAARIDGCSTPFLIWRIVVPLLQPAMGTLGLITFIASWNNFIGPLIVMRSPEMYTLPLALRSMQSPVNTEWGAVMAGSAIATLPLLVLFAISSRRLIDGLTAGAVK